MPPSALWSQTQEVSHLYPVYNTDGVATSGIKEWKTTTADATIVTDASEAVTWNAGWYVVTGNITLSKGAVCQGDVHLILADGTNPPTTVIAKDRTDDTDIASQLAGKQYVKIEEITLDDIKADAIAEITTAGQGIQNENLNNWINAAIHDINAAGTDTKEKVDDIKGQILDVIYFFLDGKAEGDAAGYQRAKDELPTDAEDAA